MPPSKKLPLWPFIGLDCLLIAAAFYLVLFTAIPNALLLGLGIILVGSILLIFPVVYNHRLTQDPPQKRRGKTVVPFEETTEEDEDIDLHIEFDDDNEHPSNSTK